LFAAFLLLVFRYRRYRLADQFLRVGGNEVDQAVQVRDHDAGVLRHAEIVEDAQ